MQTGWKTQSVSCLLSRAGREKGVDFRGRSFWKDRLCGCVCDFECGSADCICDRYCRLLLLPSSLSVFSSSRQIRRDIEKHVSDYEV